MELIPAIDLKEGRVVRLLHGDFSAETRYEISPEGLYARYADAGARHLHIVDLDAARGHPGNDTLWAPLAALGRLRVQLGGGVRTDEALHKAFTAGVTRAVIGSVAVSDPARVQAWLQHFGPERIVLALDVRIDADGVPRLATHGWLNQTDTSLWDTVRHYEAHGLRHVLCTDVSRDGAMSGPNDALYRQAVERHPNIAWQASGGIRHVDDLALLAQIGVAGAVSGRALLEGHLSMEDLQPFLPAA